MEKQVNTRSKTTIKPVTETDLIRLKHLFESDKTNANKSSNAYVSNIVTVQSLLNIRPNRRDRSIPRYDDRIVINVAGDQYETYRTTLERFPKTLLGNGRRRRVYFDKHRNEYFFDRNRSCFQSILYYYQSYGRIRRPNNVSLDIFLEEINFFQLGDEALNQIRKDENIGEVKKVRLPKNRFRRLIWATLEYPDFSRFAKFLHIFSLLMILLSVVILAVETLPAYTDIDELKCEKGNRSNQTDIAGSSQFYTCHIYFSTAFFILQTICVAVFTLEFFLRLLSTPSLFDFVKSPMNWIDLLAFAPFYVSLGIRLSGKQNEIGTSTYVGLRLLRILRLARILKFYRIFKSIKSLRVLVSTIKQSLLDFVVMFSALALSAFLFGAGVYFAENDSNGEVFDSIPKATYWGIITITSVGYGDMSPITPIGRLIACCCALFGSAMVGTLLSVLVDRYQRVYARKLYINEEPIDFHDYSEENESEIEFGVFSHDEGRQFPTSTSENILSTNQESSSRKSSNIHFILGYVTDPDEQLSESFLNKIQSIISQKQRLGLPVFFHRISDYDSSPIGVTFDLASSDDEPDFLTEIVPGSRKKGNVLKKFERRSSSKTEQSVEKTDWF